MERITDLRDKLSGTLGRNFVDGIVESVTQHPEDFEPLYRLIFDKEAKITWRAVWACEKLCERCPEMLDGKQEELMTLAMQCGHGGTKRELLSLLCILPVAEPFPVAFFDFCLDRMLSSDEPIAVQALCIKMAYRIALTEPELLKELQAYLENAQPEYYSKGVGTTIRNTLKSIYRQLKL